MKISTKSRYGLRMLVDLYKHNKDVPITLASIAKRQEVSVNYLEQVASDLKRAGLVHSIKGSNGGYVIAKEPSEIIVGDVIRLLEGDVRLTDNFVKDETILQITIRQSVYDIVNSKIENLVDSISLEKLVNENITIFSLNDIEQ